MEFKIDASHNKYIKIVVSGLVSKTEIISAISELIQHPEYMNKHSFWDFRLATMGLSIGDIHEVVGILSLFKPNQKPFANKSALLVSGQMNSAMAKVFTTMTKLLPFKYKVFKDKVTAVSYLCP